MEKTTKLYCYKPPKFSFQKLNLKKLTKWSYIGVFLGILWIFLFPAVTITTGELKTRNTYFSENALLTGVAESHIDRKEIEYARNLEEKYQTLGENCSDAIRHDLMEITGERSYTQQYVDPTGRNETNIYGILRASPMGEGKEAIVLSVNYPAPNQHNRISSLSIGLSLLKYLRQAKWLAKDVILLVTNDGEKEFSETFAPGISAWVKAYHEITTDATRERLYSHAGVLRGAIMLDFEPYNDGISILTSGINGQLPNLDLVNTAVDAFQRQGILSSLGACWDHHDYSGFCCYRWIDYLLKKVSDLGIVEAEVWNRYMNRVSNLFEFIRQVAYGPAGAHSHFLQYNVDSISIKGYPNNIAQRNYVRAIEAIIRPISNLEEKFHQSFYFYLLPSMDTFVSIGEYYYSLMLIILPAILKAIEIVTNEMDQRYAWMSFLIAYTLLIGQLTFTVLSTIDTRTISNEAVYMIATILTLLQWISSIFILPYAEHILSSPPNYLSYEKILLLAIQKKEQEKALKHHIQLESDEEYNKTRDQLSQDIKEDKGGKNSSRFMLCAGIIASTCVLGILDYPFALLAAISNILFMTCGTCKSNRWSFVVAILCSPLNVLFVSYQIFGVMTVNKGIGYVIGGHQLMGLLFLRYFCFSHLPMCVLVAYLSHGRD